MKKVLTLALLILSIAGAAQVSPKLQAKLDQQAEDIVPKVIEWHRHFHQYPELSNRETRTGARIAEHLKAGQTFVGGFHPGRHIRFKRARIIGG